MKFAWPTKSEYAIWVPKLHLSTRWQWSYLGLLLGIAYVITFCSTIIDLLIKTASTLLVDSEFSRQICPRVKSCCAQMLVTDTKMNGWVFLSVSLTSKELSILPKRAALPVFNALGLCCQLYEWCKSLLTLIPSVQAICKYILPALKMSSNQQQNKTSQVMVQF